MFKIHTLYDTPGHPGVTFEEPTMTQQHFQDDCDINRIIERFTKTGILPEIASNFEFADVSDVPSYQEAMHFIMDAQDQFMELPAKLRKEFDNDPGQFLAFMEDSNNYERAIELGLIERQAEAHPKSGPETVHELNNSGAGANDTEGSTSNKSAAPAER